MEMVQSLTAVTGFGGGGGGGGAWQGLRAVSGGGGGGGSSALLSIGQGVTTAFSMMTTIGQGIAAKSVYDGRADLEEANSELEVIEGREEKNMIRQRFAEVLSDQTVAFAAAGVRVGSGVARMNAGEVTKKANRDLSRSEVNIMLRRSGRLNNASALRQRGQGALSQSIIKAMQTGVNTGMDILQRG